MDPDHAARSQVLARLAQSREELTLLLDPPPPEPGEASSLAAADGFPRSRTMRALLSSRGLGAMGALVAGLLLARPALALRLLRMVPAGAVGKMLLARLINSVVARHEPP